MLKPRLKRSLTCSLLLVASFFLLRCDNKEVANSDKKPEAQSDKIAERSGDQPMPDNSPIELGAQLNKLEGKPLGDRIEEASNIATRVYESLGVHRENLFRDGFVQATTIFCSTHRLERLATRRSTDFHRDMMLTFLTRLERVVNRQRFVRASRRLVDQTGGERTYTAVFSMSSARPYREHEVSIATYRLSDQEFRSGSFQLDPLAACRSEFLEPIPGSKEARNLESKAVATVIARSIHRLQGLRAKLASIEGAASKANSLRLILGQLKKDLEFDAVDPAITKEKILGYERDLRHAVSLLRAYLPDINKNYSVSEEEVQEILKVFGPFS